MNLSLFVKLRRICVDLEMARLDQPKGLPVGRDVVHAQRYGVRYGRVACYLPRSITHFIVRNYMACNIFYS